MVWNWLESVLIAAESSVSRKTTPNQRGIALWTYFGMMVSVLPCSVVPSVTVRRTATRCDSMTSGRPSVPREIVIAGVFSR